MRDMRKGEAGGGEVEWMMCVVEGGSWPEAQSRGGIDGRSGTSLRLQPTPHNPLTGQSPIEIPDGWV